MRVCLLVEGKTYVALAWGRVDAGGRSWGARVQEGRGACVQECWGQEGMQDIQTTHRCERKGERVGDETGCGKNELCLTTVVNHEASGRLKQARLIQAHWRPP